MKSLFRKMLSFRGLCLLLVLFMMRSELSAEFASASLIPIERLLKHAQSQIEKEPGSAGAHYTLGRVHYLAFHVKHDQIPAYGDQAAAQQWMISQATSGDKLAEAKAVKLTNDQLIEHATKALHEFDEALKLDPKNGLAALGRACLLEEFAAWTKPANISNVPDELKNINSATLREAYAKALELSLPKDSKISHRPAAGIQSLTSYEAATALIRLADSDAKLLTETEAAQVKKALAAIADFKALPMGPVTPIVFSFKRAEHLSELLDPQRVVDFDLRGYGWRERWSWVKPELGFLVWDPEHKGEITSARQLFGGYTFEIFRNTGYDALAALDDDGDGALTRSEMEGISVWFDRNCDGKSSPDEVTPLEQLGVVSVSVKSESFDGIHPMNARGITFKDGRVLPTWDWMAEPLERKPGRLATVKRNGK